MHFVLANGTRLAYDAYGKPSNPPIVLLHGLGLDRRSWKGVAEALADDRRVYCPDMRGHGESDRSEAYTYEVMRDDVVAFAGELGLARTDLIGHSVGAIVAWLVAQAAPELVDRLVVEDSVPPRGDQHPEIMERPQGPLPFDFAVVEGLHAQLDDPDPQWWDQMPQISAPTLVLSGSYESVQRLREAAQLLPSSELVTIPVGHHIHRDAESTFLKVVSAFLSAV
jgi:3-oxoadipate enol-lactonase